MSVPSTQGCVYAFPTVPSSTTVSVTTNSGGPTSVTLPAGEYEGLPSLLLALSVALTAGRPVTAGAWSIGLTSEGRVTIAVTNGTFSLSWTSADLRDLLGHTANITTQTSVTGTNQARGLWIPDCPLNADSDTDIAPLDSDLRTTLSPNGAAYTKRGTSLHRHTNLVWSHVHKSKVFKARESLTNESYERFYFDTIEGVGHAWFSPSSKMMITDHRENGYVGENGFAGSINGWIPVNVPKPSEWRMASASPRPSVNLWEIRWPEIVAEGGI